MDNNIATFLRNDTKTVLVRFFKDSYKDMRSESNQNMTLLGAESIGVGLSDKEYLYVTDLDLQVSDYVMVYVMGGIPKVAFVTEVHDEVKIPPNSEITFKWIVDKIDLKRHFDNLEKNAEITNTIASAYKKNLKNQFRDVVLGGLDRKTKTDLIKLLGK